MNMEMIIIPVIVFGIIIAITIGMIAGMWTTFEKAGRPGWACLVPIYNYVVMLEIAGKPLWWILLMFIPAVNFIVGIMVLAALSIVRSITVYSWVRRCNSILEVVGHS